jgi:hypothetical protein
VKLFLCNDIIISATAIHFLALSIESQKGQGQSNIVFSSSISVADAIRAASKLKADLKFSEVEASFVDVPDMQEDQILHDAAKVLRGSLHAVEISKDFYPSPSDLSHHRSLQFIPPSLMTFLSWLVDDNCFHIESDYNALSHDKARKCIAVAEMIISLHKAIECIVFFPSMVSVFRSMLSAPS